MNDKLSCDTTKKALSKNELKKVRGVCLMNGITLSQWFRAQGFSTNTAFNAVLGRRPNGPVSKKIVEAVKVEFGV